MLYFAIVRSHKMRVGATSENVQIVMRYRFENYELDTTRHEFRAFGVLRLLEPRVFDVLLHFVRGQGRLVSRDELITTIWDGRIVSESTIDACVHAVRKAVDDNGRSQRLIKTVPRRGYRFLAEVKALRDIKWGTLSEDDPSNWGKLPFEGRPTVVVLPIENLDGDHQQKYFADGITDDIIIGLSRFRSLFVTGRGSSFTYRDTVIEPSLVGNELGVRYLLRGSLRRSDDRVSNKLPFVRHKTKCVHMGRSV